MGRGRLLPLVAAIAIVTGIALFGVLIADSYVEYEERPVAALAELQHALDDEARIEVIVDFGSRIQPSDTAALAADAKSIASTEKTLEQTNPGEPLLETTVAGIRRYQLALDQEITDAEKGLYTDGSQLSSQLVQPEHARLLNNMEASIKYFTSQARLANLIGTIIGSAIVALAGLACGIMVWLGWRRREATRQAEAAAVQRSEARFRALLQSSFDVITVVGEDGTIKWCSDAVKRLFGYTAEEMMGRKFEEWIHPDDLAQGLWENPDNASDAANAVSRVVECRVQHRNGRWRWVGMAMTSLHGHPDIQGTILNLRDITERKSLETQLAHQALHDPLTGLGNRTLLRHQLDELLARRAPGEPVSVLFIDLDGFKAINDGLGHSAGDALLVQVGQALEHACRGHDIATRMGGDEFAVLLQSAARDEAVQVAERLLRMMETPFLLGGREVLITASVGVICLEDDTQVDAETLLRRADLAMYAAKAAGKNRVQVFEPGLETSVLRRLDMDGELRRAIDGGHMVLQYQPLLSLKDGSMHGVEALVRWKHPTWGMVPPLEFIGLAEETGLIVRLGLWVLETACAQLAHWSRVMPETPFSMSVNVSSRQMREPDFIEAVLDVLKRTEVATDRLVIEITESVVVEDLESVYDQLELLRSKGVKIAIDDFGSGYSSLSYLRKLPCDIVKIDRAFVEGVDTNTESRLLTRAIVRLLDGLGVVTVAEGIETEAQSEYLTSLGVDIGQGYLFARPLDADSVLPFVNRDSQTAAAAS